MAPLTQWGYWPGWAGYDPVLLWWVIRSVFFSLLAVERPWIMFIFSGLVARKEWSQLGHLLGPLSETLLTRLRSGSGSKGETVSKSKSTARPPKPRSEPVLASGAGRPNKNDPLGRRGPKLGKQQNVTVAGSAHGRVRKLYFACFASSLTSRVTLRALFSAVRSLSWASSIFTLALSPVGAPFGAGAVPIGSVEYVREGATKGIVRA